MQYKRLHNSNFSIVAGFVRILVKRTIKETSIASLCFAALACTCPASAATITVTSLADNGGAGDCGRRSTPRMPTPGSTIIFKGGMVGTITLTSALPTIICTTTIQGPGASAIGVSGAGKYRPFKIDIGSGTVTIPVLRSKRATLQVREAAESLLRGRFVYFQLYIRRK